MIGGKTVKAHLLRTLALLSALMLGGNVLGIWGGYRGLVAMEKIYRNDALGVELLTGIKADTLDVVASYSSVNSFSRAEQKGLLESVANDMKRIERNRDAYLGLADTGAHQIEQDKFVRNLRKVRSFLDGMQATQAISDSAALATEMSKGLGTYVAFQESIEKLISLRKDDADARFVETQLQVRRLLVLLILISVCGFLVASVSYVSLSRKVIRPLSDAAADCERIASGNLCMTRPTSVHGGEIGRLFDAFTHMQVSLNEIVGRVRSGSESVANATGQIALGNIDLSQRTEEQAAVLQGVVADLQEFAMRVEKNSERAGMAMDVVSDVAEIATSGHEEMNKVVSTMNVIVQGSLRMNEIISTIESLSFQTNILALNASVESARAGEHGRGFAVVASEVRSLAQRSAAAAREISDLIRNSSNEIGRGSELVGAAGQRMDRIAEAVRGASVMMREIAEVSAEQNSDINRTKIALGQIEQTTLQNAALVEEASAAANALQEEASRLALAMQFFTTGDCLSAV
ncbi:methyl-accepting chemotaxis protein [Burkholderia sp. Ac-20353]|uniref:methyl-accepting chemotaxis protein n=1 Tax=Burkholderia sp. Ac-20353 TaxID=2703894 RepID=UPI00197C5086|nr:methyl-accepting chemotaxis protein [Burkholderia sp. Ac-20353]MBN3787672.1 hypothetical protein [Burkholderia sp. Ac-20353]